MVHRTIYVRCYGLLVAWRIQIKKRTTLHITGWFFLYV